MFSYGKQYLKIDRKRLTLLWCTSYAYRKVDLKMQPASIVGSSVHHQAPLVSRSSSCFSDKSYSTGFFEEYPGVSLFNKIATELHQYTACCATHLSWKSSAKVAKIEIFPEGRFLWFSDSQETNTLPRADSLLIEPVFLFISFSIHKH